jgi:hypothetical protein
MTFAAALLALSACGSDGSSGGSTPKTTPRGDAAADGPAPTTADGGSDGPPLVATDAGIAGTILSFLARARSSTKSERAISPLDPTARSIA